MEAEGISLAAMIGIVGAILTVLIKFFDVLDSWKKSRKNNLKVKKEIDDTIKEVEFINGWLTAVNSATKHEEGEKRRSIALNRLDHLMSNYQRYCHSETAEKMDKGEEGASNKWFYVISAFLGLAILGLFVDDNDNWSFVHFQNNLDSDTVVGFVFIFVVWFYFLWNSRFMRKSRRLSEN